MIEEHAWVVSTGDGYAWVETRRQTACAACHASCSSATIARLWGRRRPQLYVLSDIPLRAGDEVVVGIAESAFLRGSLAVYIVPLLTMFLGTLLGKLLSTDAGEGSSIFLGLVGLAGGFGWLRWYFTRKIRADSRYQPTVLRRLAAAEQ